jgi:hypothetical protein
MVQDNVGIFQAMIRPPLFFSIDFINLFNTLSQSQAFFFFSPLESLYPVSVVCISNATQTRLLGLR